MCKMSFLATELNIFFDIKKINPLHLQVWTLWNVVEFSTLTNLITWKSHLWCVLARPPGGAPGWTLVFTLDMLDRRAQLALGTLPPVVITGWLQGLELGQQLSMGLCFHWVPWQEVKDFLSTLGETLTASIRGEWSSFCLKTLSQEATVISRMWAFSILESGSKLRSCGPVDLRLFNAVVDTVSVHLFHNWFSQLQRRRRNHLDIYSLHIKQTG